jgi:hypothetical protein
MSWNIRPYTASKTKGSTVTFLSAYTKYGSGHAHFLQLKLLAITWHGGKKELLRATLIK